MQYDQFTQLISTVGFPIVCCVAMFIQNNRQIKELSEALHKVETALEKLCASKTLE